MRVGIIATSYPPNRDGVSVSIASLVEGLRRSGHESFVITPRARGAVYPDYVLPVRSLPIPKNLSAELRLPYGGLRSGFFFFRRNKVDVIHSVDPFLSGPQGIVFAKLLGVPHIHTFHTHFETYPYFRFPGYEYSLRLMARQVCNLTDTVVAPTEKIATYLAKIGVRVPIHTLLNIPPERSLWPTDRDTAVAEKFRLMPDDFVFVTFGRVAKEKGLDRGLAALSPLMRKNPKVKYLIAGHGPAINTFKGLARDLGIAGQVIFTGPYDRVQLPKITSVASAFLFTSRTDTQAITLLEAMQCGLPVVSIDDDCVDYILQHGKNGLKIKESQLAKACARLVREPQLRDRLAANALKTVEKFDPEEILEKWIGIFKMTISRS